MVACDAALLSPRGAYHSHGLGCWSYGSNNDVMNINARSAGPPPVFLLASRNPVSCNSEKTRFSDAPHAPASRRPRCRCRSRWPRTSVPQLRSSRTLWPGLERRADKPPLKTSGAWPRCSRPAVWMMRHHPQRSRAAYTQISFFYNHPERGAYSAA